MGYCGSFALNASPKKQQERWPQMNGQPVERRFQMNEQMPSRSPNHRVSRIERGFYPGCSSGTDPLLDPEGSGTVEQNAKELPFRVQFVLLICIPGVRKTQVPLAAFHASLGIRSHHLYGLRLNCSA